MSFLQVKEIDIYYEDMPAVQNASLAIKERALVSIIGGNGAGKTSIINTISGLIKPRQGEIWLEDDRIDTLPACKVVNKGVVQIPEGRRLFPFMTVLENLKIGAYCGRAKDDWRSTVEGVFQMLPRLEERKNQMALTLSGGEQQMLAIGRGLMAKPKLIMLDEPSLGLAPILTKRVFEIVAMIKEQGTTVLLVEQDVRHSLELSDWAYVLENGRFVMEGPGQELLGNPKITSAYLGI